MQAFRIHTIETAPEKSKPALEGLKKNFGFVPNAPPPWRIVPCSSTLFIAGFGSFHGGSLSESEREGAAHERGDLQVRVATAFHSTLALKARPESDVSAIRQGKLPQDPKRAALSGLARALIESKGHAVEPQIDAFLAGDTCATRLLEAVAGIAISTMAALTANMAETPVEDLFKAQAWKVANL